MAEDKKKNEDYTSCLHCELKKHTTKELGIGKVR